MEHNEYTDLVKAVFSNQKGEKLLKVWSEMYGKRISYQEGDSIGNVSFREGERNFYQNIEDVING